MNSDMVKAEKFDHLHLVYHFIVPLNNSPHATPRPPMFLMVNIKLGERPTRIK